MSALPVDVRFDASEEFRALLRAHRRGGGGAGASSIAHLVAEQARTPLAVVESAPPEPPAAPAPPPAASWDGFQPVRLRRFGQAPYSFQGALAAGVSTLAGLGQAVWHEIALYLTEHGPGLVLHVRSEPRPGCEGWVRPLALVHVLNSVEDGWAGLRAFDPAHCIPAGGSGLAAAECCAAFVDRIAAARADYLEAVRMFCGPRHAIVQELSARYGANQEGEAA